jgi:uncharacterized protein (TIGR02145 family)
LCPVGWHMPTDAEWSTLESVQGGSSVAGGKMKESGTAHWVSPNTGADNVSGFTALPGGGRTDSTYFRYLGYCSQWWSSTEYNSSYSYYRSIYNSSANIYRNYGPKHMGFSVRCVKD